MARIVEGWPAGVQLMASTLRHASCDASQPAGVQSEGCTCHAFSRLDGSQAHVFAYLAEDVFDQQPAHRKAFLLQTAILDQMCGPLCDAVLGMATQGGQAEAAAADSYSRLILEELEHANIFVAPAEEEPHWYRYHHMFRAFLRERLGRERPQAIAGLHRRASHWYACNNQLDHAIDHALAAGEPARAAELLELAAAGFIERGQPARLQRWLEHLPKQLRAERPALCLLAAELGRAGQQHRPGLAAADQPATAREPPATQAPALIEPLSERELEVLRLVGRGASNQAIAAALVISIGTVKSHINHILGKLAATNRTEAVSRARQLGLLTL